MCMCIKYRHLFYMISITTMSDVNCSVVDRGLCVLVEAEVYVQVNSVQILIGFCMELFPLLSMVCFLLCLSTVMVIFSGNIWLSFRQICAHCSRS